MSVATASAGQPSEAQLNEKYGMKVKTSHILQRRLSKGGKGQYFDSGDYNMQGKTAEPSANVSAGVNDEGSVFVGASRLPVQSKLASEAMPAVTPGPGAARVPVRRKSQPSKLGTDQASPTAPKTLGSPLGGGGTLSMQQPGAE
ncbi:uncharacterized protein LOC135808750 [Sycon ciliatum]|uniref:uncharacterized protein LOC135808750 n=1 Tax=Sycon ciliatum TaxID=27933 RepID=UPI0031F615A6